MKNSLLLAIVFALFATYGTYAQTIKYSGPFTHGSGNSALVEQDSIPEGNRIINKFYTSLNPSSTELTATYELKLKPVGLTIELYDMSGNLIKEVKPEGGQQGINNYTVDVSSLSQGSYIAKLIIGVEQEISKFTILR